MNELKKIIKFEILTHRQAVERKAFGFWLAEGCPIGRDVAHWHRAESEVLSIEAEWPMTWAKPAPVAINPVRFAWAAIAKDKLGMFKLKQVRQLRLTK